MNLRQKKKTLYLALALLLVCAIFLGAVSYAWLAISTMPEVTGIETNVGANGSLEIALLSDDTYVDPELIKAKIGSSLEVQDAIISNLYWGNVIDLSDSSYGLGYISLVPARLDVTEALVVNSSLLLVPDYGTDGRFTAFSGNSASGVYADSSFMFTSDGQRYGVRGVGKVAGVSAQESALSASRTAVRTNTVSARTQTEALWKKNGPELFEILHYLYGGGAVTLDKEHTLDVISDTAEGLLDVYDYLDSAIRQGIIGYASLMTQDEETFKLLKQGFENKSVPLSMLVDTLPIALPDSLVNIVEDLESDIGDLNQVILDCAAYAGTDLSDSMLEDLISNYVDPENAYINDHALNQWGSGDALVLTLYAGGDDGSVSGKFHNVARYAGDYGTFFEYAGASVEVTTLMDADQTPYLEAVYQGLNQQDNTDNEDYIEIFPLEDICGFAIDMAFRCNQDSDLLLQTDATERVAGQTDVAETQGGGSYMRFTSEQLSTDQMLPLMDAIRIGFLDNRNSLIGVAKLNTSNYQETEDGVAAALYLYDFTVSESGSIVMGERRSENSAVTSLSQNTAQVLTVVVWLDGDSVTNSLAAIQNQSMTGTLNLQFSSSADLKPMQNGSQSSGIITPSEPSGEETVPSDTQPDETEPEESEPVLPEILSDYYLSVDGDGQYTIYSLDDSGSRTYEMAFEGNLDEENETVTITSVIAYPDQGIVIPARAISEDSNVNYAVSINPDYPFNDLDVPDMSIYFVSVNGKKVGVTSEDLSHLFGGRKDSLYAVDGSGLDVSGVTNMNGLFNLCSSLQWLDIGNWDVSNVTDMNDMFAYCENLTELDVGNWVTSSLTDMSYMFYGCHSLKKLDVSNWDTSCVTDMSVAFFECNSIEELNIGNWDTSNVTDMSRVFYGCSSIVELDVSGWSTDKVTNMYGMFAGCEQVSTLDVSNFVTDAVTDIKFMFYNCENVDELDVSGWKTSLVTSMNSTFSGCSGLEELDISSFDTTNVSDMSFMFAFCNNLTSLDVSRWDTTSVEDMSYLFTGCEKVTELDVSGWNTALVTSMNSIFNGCSGLEELDVGSWSTANVIDMRYMFSYCNNLTKLDVSAWTTDNVTDMRLMFSNCENLSVLDVSHWNVKSVTSMKSMFWYCTNLTQLDISGWDLTNVDTTYMFFMCPAGEQYS